MPKHDTDKPVEIEAGLAIDDRGGLTFANGFDFEGVKRFYMIANHRQNFVRAWHGHKKEAKYLMAVSGSFVVGAVKVDDWDNPSKDLEVHRFVLSAMKPSILYLPAGYANGLMNLSEDSKLMVYSTSSLEESKGDDFRFDARHWDIWGVIER